MQNECIYCGQIFEHRHRGKKICPDCERAVKHGLGYLVRVDTPEDTDAYQRSIRQKNIEAYQDTIIAEGYADRQKAKTLESVEKIDTTL